MTRADAIKELKEMRTDAWTDSRQMQALAEGIKALEQEPCDDAISRQKVLDILDDMTKDYAKSNDFEKVNGVAWVKVQKLPSVNPQEKTGHWIEKDGFDGDVYYDCSECGESWATIEGTPWDNEWNYCPNCGCRMVEPQESEDNADESTH